MTRIDQQNFNQGNQGEDEDLEKRKGQDQDQDLTQDQLDDRVFDLSPEEFNKQIAEGELKFVVDEEDEDEGAVSGKKDGDRSADKGETYTIIHNGVEHNLDRPKLIELAQKGFDYDKKVGPHSRLVQLIEQDANLANVVNDHFMRKYGLLPPQSAAQPGFHNLQDPNAAAQQQYRQPGGGADGGGGGEKVDIVKELKSKARVKKLADYDDEGEWLLDNLTAALGVIVPQLQSQTQRQQQQQIQQQQYRQPGGNPQAAVVNAVHQYDPQFSNVVLPVIDEYAEENLTPSEYKAYTSSFPGFLQFYDRVKGDVLNGRWKPSGQRGNGNQGAQGIQGAQSTRSPDDSSGGNKGKRIKRKFNLKPGGGTPPSNSGKKAINVWDLPREQFSRLVDSRIAKG